MKKFLKIAGFRLLQWTWGFPQTFLGFLYTGLLRLNGWRSRPYECAIATYHQSAYGYVSLGMYFTFPGELNLHTAEHEYGHSIQSAILGPLYLLVIGIPSLMWAAFGKRYRTKYGVSYYAFYTERWADKLGKVDRKTR